MTKKSTTKTPPPMTMELGDVLSRLIESRVAFSFSFVADEKPERLFRAEVDEEAAFASDPVAAILGATAKAIRVNEVKIQKTREMADERERRITQVQEKLPGVKTHIPNDKGVCGNCGEKHEGGDLVSMVAQAITGATRGRVQTFVVNGPPDNPEDDGNKKDEN